MSSLMSPLEQLAADYQAANVTSTDEGNQQLVGMFDLQNKRILAEQRENELLFLRSNVEVLWLEIGRIAHEILSQKLYKYRQDENGNYFRTAKAYFAYLEEVFKEKGWALSRSTLYRFAEDYSLFVDQLGMTPQACQQLGKSALTALAPGVRRLLEEGDEGREKAVDLVQEVLAAAEANEGLPKQAVIEAVDDATERITKSLAVEFKPTAFGWRVGKLTLWWGAHPINLLGEQMSEEQAAWVAKRLGNPGPPVRTPSTF